MNPWWCPHCGMKFRSAIAEARHRHNFPLLCKRKKGKNAPILDRDQGHDDEPAQAPEAEEAPAEPGVARDHGQDPPLATGVTSATMPREPGNSIPGGNGDWVRREEDHTAKPK